MFPAPLRDSWEGHGLDNILCVDGVVDARRTFRGSIPANNFPLTIGSNNSTPTAQNGISFRGLIDEPMIGTAPCPRQKSNSASTSNLIRKSLRPESVVDTFGGCADPSALRASLRVHRPEVRAIERPSKRRLVHHQPRRQDHGPGKSKLLLSSLLSGPFGEDYVTIIA
jgi:hypothetical protein